MKRVLSITVGAALASALQITSVSAKPLPIAPATACTPGPNTVLSVTDVTLDSIAATNCYGVVGGNTSNTDINAIDALLFGGGQWGAEIKDNTPGDPGSGTGFFYGVNWTLSSSAGKDGTWSLSFVDTIPTKLDFSADPLVVLKASDRFAAYYFNDFVFDTTSQNGTWDINFLNNGGKTPDLSHFSLYFRDGTPLVNDPCELPGANCTPTENDVVPEPATLALLGLGLLGAGVAGRRKQ